MSHTISFQQLSKRYGAVHPGGATLLPPAAAALVLVGWAALVSLAATRLTMHRELR